MVYIWCVCVCGVYCGRNVLYMDEENTGEKFPFILILWNSRQKWILICGMGIIFHTLSRRGIIVIQTSGYLTMKIGMAHLHSLKKKKKKKKKIEKKIMLQRKAVYAIYNDSKQSIQIVHWILCDQY